MKVPYELRLLWAQVPRVHCKGLCWDSCGPMSASSVERAILADQGIDIPGMDSDGDLARWEQILGVNERGEPVVLACPALTDDRRCGVYQSRPLICRFWGAVNRLPCEHGCQIEGEPLPDEEAWGLLAAAEAIQVRD